MKTLTLTVPDELGEAVEKIGDIEERVVAFLRNQAALEIWREQRHNPALRKRAEAAIRRGQELQRSVPREELVRRFRVSREAVDNAGY